MNAIDAMLTSRQSAFNTLLKKFAQIKAKLNTKINKIKKLYESKKKNLTRMMLSIIIIKFFDMMKHATRHEWVNKTKITSECFEK